MDCYVVRIYRRAGRMPRILIGTVEAAGRGRKMAFSNIEELWEILRCRKSRELCAPPDPRRRIRKEVVSATATSDMEASAEGVRQTKPDSEL